MPKPKNKGYPLRSRKLEKTKEDKLMRILETNLKMSRIRSIDIPRNSIYLFLFVISLTLLFLQFNRKIFTDDVAKFPPLLSEKSPGSDITSNSLSIKSLYSQVGILTGDDSNGKIILPLIGKRIRSNKFHYYTISNTGTIHSKLPIKIKGKLCSLQLGCDEVYEKDMVYVEGYQQSFYVTIYENESFQYSETL